MSYTPVVNEPLDSTTPEPEFGPTSARPTAPAMMQLYFDTTLDEPIWWNVSLWVNSSGAFV